MAWRFRRSYLVSAREVEARQLNIGNKEPSDMTAFVFPNGYGPLPTGEQLNSLAGAGATGPTGPTGATGPTGPAFSTASPTFTGTTTAAALTATGAVILSNASVKMTAIVTADPHVVGQLWSNVGVLTISAG